MTEDYDPTLDIVDDPDGDGLTPRQRQAQTLAKQWYIIDITGTNEVGELATTSIKASGDLEFVRHCWSIDKGWTDTTIISVTPTTYYNH